MDETTTLGSLLAAGIAVAVGLHKTLDKLLPTKTNGNGSGNGANKLEAAIQHLVEAMDRHHDEETKLLNQLVVAVTVMATKFDERMARRDTIG